MAVVKGVKEQVHLPLYDCVEVKPGKQLGETLTSNLLRFFVDVTGKTKLLTNMQSSSLLPHWNTFEARALRVVISDLCPQFPKFSPDLVIDLPNVKVRDAEDNAGSRSEDSKRNQRGGLADSINTGAVSSSYQALIPKRTTGWIPPRQMRRRN